jgi:hypothetical protein
MSLYLEALAGRLARSRWMLAGAAGALLLGSSPGHSQAAPAHWQVQRDLLIGSREVESASLTQVGDLAVGSDGKIYVLQPQEQLVRVFGSDGKLQRALGRRGSGPGEFQSPKYLGWRGDTLVVTDPASQRLTGFLGNGQVAFTAALASISGFMPRALLANGSVLGSPIVYSHVAASGEVAFDRLEVTSRSAGPVRPFARLPFNHYMVHFHLDGPEGPTDSYFPQPFGDADMYDVDPAGRWVASVSRPTPPSARGSFVITRREPSGSVRWRTTVRYPAGPLPAWVVQDTVDLYASRFHSFSLPAVSQARIAAAIRDQLYVPARLNGVAAVVSGRDGTTWVRRTGTAAVATWMVFDERGRVVAYASVPANLTVYAADRHQVWGVLTDRNEIPFVARYRVVPATG